MREVRLTISLESAAQTLRRVQPTNLRVVQPHTSRRMVTVRAAGRRIRPTELLMMPDAVRRGVKEADQLNSRQRREASLNKNVMENELI